ncbi:MAG: response regulator transcription factor [Cyclobacteriaceae bacterium]|nr:response regulator transcription factor [Cyclobacteriaceae bacterium]
MKNNLLVYLADDHTVVRKGMLRLLNTFSRVGQIGEAANGKELIQLVEARQPDAVILDVEMPVLGGIETTRYLAEHFPDVKILILTMHTEEIFVIRLMDLGVHGLLSKSCGPDEVEKALYAIVDKDFYRNDIMERALRKLESNVSVDKSYQKLTSRELEILLLICQELSPGEISERLQISEKTFFNHRANILSKVNCRGNVGLVKFAHEKGLLHLSKPME